MRDPAVDALSHVFCLARWTEAEARTVLAAWTHSGLTLHAFARAHASSPQRLYAWQRRLAASAPAAPDTPPALRFVELRVPASAPRESSRLELVLPSGTVVRVDGAVDAATLRTVLEVLRETRAC